MATAITIHEDELDTLTPEMFSEVEPESLPEGTVIPDRETACLIADVLSAAQEFRPIHQKLKDVVKKHRTKIVLLKNKFGVRMGTQGYPLLIGKAPMFWEEFVNFYFGVTSRRLNQLLDVRDEKETTALVTLTPDEEKPLYKKGVRAGLQKSEGELMQLRSTLSILEPKPKAQELTERILHLEALLEAEREDTKKAIGHLTLQKERMIRDPQMAVMDVERPRPTVDDWKNLKSHPGGTYKLKYFAEAGESFWDRYRNIFSQTAFRKALEKVGDPKHRDDLATLAKLIQSAADDLRTLAEVVKPE
jgi:hypothetical protein